MECPKKHWIRWSSFRSITSTQGIRALLPRLLLILAIPFLLGSLLQACGGGGGGPAPSNIKSITIDPINPSIAAGTKIQLHATANFKNKTTKEITESVTWTSANSKVAIVSNSHPTKGLSGGVAVGATTVTVQFQGKTGSSTFNVTHGTLKSVTVKPVNPVIAKGTTVQLAAIGAFSDGSTQDLTTQVTWSSGNGGIATVSNTAGTLGLVTGVSVGNTPITATFSGIAGSTTVTVSAATVSSITITVPVDSIAKGTTLQLIATCKLSDGTTQGCTNDVTWASSDSGVATVSNTSPTQGLVTGNAVGTSTITASLNGQQGSATITVTPASLKSITVTPPNPSIAAGFTVGLTATGNYSDGSTQNLTRQVSWTSADNTIAQVSNLPVVPGVVTGIRVGSIPITATLPLNGVQGSVTVTVTPAVLTSIAVTPSDSSIPKGLTEQLRADGTFSDGTTQNLTTQVSWTSSDTTIAKVGSSLILDGLVAGAAVGTATITATQAGVSGTSTVRVTAATLEMIEVTPPEEPIAKGTTGQVKATGIFSDGTTQDLTTQVSWTSADNMIAQVSNVAGSEGLVTGLSLGSTQITATLNGIGGSDSVTVSAAILQSITVGPPNPPFAKGTSVQFTATGNFSDGSTQNLNLNFGNQVSWTENDTAIATVDGNGLVKGVGAGTAIITATFEGISGSTTETVTTETLVSLAITPAPIPPPFITIPVGTTIQLTVIGTFSDGSTRDLTTDPALEWGDSAPAFVTVGPHTGLVTGVQVTNPQFPNGVLVQVVGLGQNASINVAVSSASVTSIAVTPANPIAKGTTVQLTATCTFTGGHTQDCTNDVTWASANPTIAPVSNASGTQGVVTGLAVGSTPITATFNGMSGSTTVTVTAATLTQIIVTPANKTVSPHTEVQMMATAVFSDNTTQDVTAQADWTSSDDTVAHIISSSSPNTNGTVTARDKAGTTTITATVPALGSIKGSTSLTVS